MNIMRTILTDNDKVRIYRTFVRNEHITGTFGEYAITPSRMRRLNMALLDVKCNPHFVHDDGRLVVIANR